MTAVGTDRFVYHRFPISAHRPICPQWGRNPKYQHGWFLPRIGDVDGDGRLELCYVKGSGEQVVYDVEGRERWRWRDQPGRVSGVRVDSNVPLFDFDDRGGLDLIVPRHRGDRLHLYRIDAATGDVLACSPRPMDLVPPPASTRINLVPFLVEPGRWGVLLHQDYAGLTAYDSELRRLWSTPLPSLGHTTIPIDIDGDGREELYAGVYLLDADGQVRWDRRELLEGTGEDHCDTNPVTCRDHEVELLFGPGLRSLDPHGRVAWSFEDADLTEVQSIRLLHRPGGDLTLVPTDLPATRRLVWRGIQMRSLDSITYFLNAERRVVGRAEGCHIPTQGDFDGDGRDELVLLAPDLHHLSVLDHAGCELERIPVQERVYVSDLRLAPLLPELGGEQIVFHEWSEDWTEAHCVLIGNPRADFATRRWDPLASARWTPY